jgi:hypothetical protein
MRGLVVITVVWLALILAGFVILGRETYRPAPRAIIASTFPASPTLALDPQRYTLLVFVHPQCPCTEATLSNLDRLRTQAGGNLAVTIVFTIPPGAPPGWEKGRLWTAANHLTSVSILRDVNGVEARRFGVTTSGHVLVYTPQGLLLFSGGITPARGQEGDSPGGLAIIHLTKEHSPSDKVEKPVFGCTLL